MLVSRHERRGFRDDRTMVTSKSGSDEAKPSARAPRPRVSRRRIRLLKRTIAAVCPFLPATFVIWMDFVRRGQDIAAFDAPFRTPYLLGAIESLLFWSLLL